MATLQSGVRAATKYMPKVVSPKVHGIIDYAVAASFWASAPFLWRKNRRAGIAALICGGAETALTLLTDFPGGLTPAISFQTHGKIEGGLAAATGLLPNMMLFGDDASAWFFRAQAMAITTVAGLTDWGQPTSLEGDVPYRRERVA